MAPAMKHALWLLLTSLVASPALGATDAQLTVESGKVRVETGAAGPTWLEDCVALDAVRLEGRIYVACGPDGVFEYEVEAAGPKRVAVRPTTGRAVALFLHRGAVWVEVERREAMPLGEPREVPVRTSSPSAGRPRTAEPAPARPTPPERAPASQGTVVRVDDLDVWVDIGSAHGLQVGDRIELRDEQQTFAVGRVERVTERTAMIGVGMGETVPAGARARGADRAPVTGSRGAPPRQGGLFEIAGELQLFLPISTLGLGSLSSLSVAHRFEFPMVVRAQMKPLGLSGSDRGNVFSIAGWLSVGLDTKLFEFTLGAGAATVNERNFDSTRKSAFSLVPAIRVGSLDGLQLAVESGTLMYDEGFQFGFVHVAGQIPISSRVSLRLRGGGGRVGHVYGDVGVRYLLQGNGGRGSVFLIGSLGGVRAAFDGLCTILNQTCSRTELAGPSLGFGLEWRP